MRECPMCTSPRIHVSRSRGRWEVWRKRLSGKRPFRCHACGWRGWGVHSGARFDPADIDRAALALAHVPALPDPLRPAGPARPPLDLADLDALDRNLFDACGAAAIAAK